MKTGFDMRLFLAPVLAGSYATRQRHIRQAEAMQSAIRQRWRRSSPWNWQLKHVKWFTSHYLRDHALSTRYYYEITGRLILKRLGK
jgi:hypothetical protein